MTLHDLESDTLGLSGWYGLVKTSWVGKKKKTLTKLGILQIKSLVLICMYNHDETFISCCFFSAQGTCTGQTMVSI